MKRDELKQVRESVMSKNPEVQEIIKLWLKEHGFEGLCGEECGCELDDLAPCGFEYSSECRAGYKHVCDFDPASKKESICTGCEDKGESCMSLQPTNGINPAYPEYLTELASLRAQVERQGKALAWIGVIEGVEK